ncbi:hypothetical protein Q5H92_00045 [Hymenobacter sp. M29]|uniref:Uncharacterized protein n=1 Tax=Hymenobacter mellowenesis TaxID=3063995 RepID=A0ABT9A5B8_9BACT|nr:hypothetical protein [Hymenobacter sp. M29]MDO7844728.1 hypothetical protein [Hymenobacter sp. M29]
MPIEPVRYPSIELVECPRCGSPRKQPPSADLCRCADCGTNYHLDWVEAGVQVRQPTAPRPSSSAHWNWLPLKALLLVVVAMAVLVGLSFLVAPAGSK